ncbi:AraC family transcriptional regulator ligand-binding domain-containing protein [Blastococcus sp. SYSU D00695]
MDFAVSRGAPGADVDRAVGTARAQLRSATGRIPVSRYYDGIEAIAELLGDPHLGLEYIASVQPDALDVLGFLAAAGDTVGDAVDRILRFHRLMTTGDTFSVERNRDTATFRVTTWGPPRPAHAHVVEMYVADTTLLVQRMTGAPVPVLDMELRHRPADPERFERLVGCAPRTGAATDRWTVEGGVLDRPMPRADPVLSRFLEGLLVPRAAPYLHADQTTRRVRELLDARLPGVAPTLAEAARALTISARTLQRRLAAEGTTFEDELDALRRAVSEASERSGLAIEETAVLCGYSELSSLHRARRRWRAEHG